MSTEATEKVIEQSENMTLYKTMADLASQQAAAYKKGSDGLREVKEIKEIQIALEPLLCGGQGLAALIHGANSEKKSEPSVDEAEKLRRQISEAGAGGDQG